MNHMMQGRMITSLRAQKGLGADDGQRLQLR